ncbi:hypothetical protein GCM10011405_10070 [Rufibacter glacialis]|uniref:Resolvase/invertase-type recombinase catalytic domain-containing protein n=1 Tax=Rufibacter glacialis TaxID=1259555 RepID=A0A5M8QLI1_9BACT|nr:recombinase family protein [Rufibacter glacialis]KAA6435503.1 hypothetical protein FOE74_06035 [Rufibacter glacialis]GGK64077.1 hypothetical protein GCM10011405_10070 [Rufibacter glacialis]
MKAALYLRVSTTKQNTDPQLSELSRLGRDSMDVSNIILELGELGVCTQVVNKNLRSLNRQRRKNSVTMMILGILAHLAEMEQEIIVERIILGQQEAQCQGKHISRPEGSVKGVEQFLKENRKVVEFLRHGGFSIREIATLCYVSAKTVMNAKHAISAESAVSATAVRPGIG